MTRRTTTPRGSPPAPDRRAAPRRSLLGVGAAAVLCAACGRDAPTQPETELASEVASGAVVAGRIAGVDAGIEDVADRLLPSLSDVAAAARLRAALRDLSTQLAEGDVARAHRSLARARAVVHDGDAEAAPDLAAVDLVLDEAAALLDAAAAPETP